MLYDFLVNAMNAIRKFAHHLIIVFLHEGSQVSRVVEIKPFLELVASLLVFVPESFILFVVVFLLLVIFSFAILFHLMKELYI